MAEYYLLLNIQSHIREVMTKSRMQKTYYLRLKKRDRLDRPLELSMTADNVEQFRAQQFNQNPDDESNHDFDELLNIKT